MSERRTGHLRRRDDVRMRAVLEAMPDAVLILDEHGAIEGCNGAVRALLGYDEHDVAGRSLQALFRSKDRERVTACIEGLTQAAAAAEPVRQDLVALCKDGTEQRIDAALSRVDGDRRQLVVVLRNWRESSRLHAQCADAQRMEAMGRLAADAAHDVSNLLAGIVGAADVVADQLEQEHPAREGVALIRDTALHGTHAMNRLVSLCRQQRTPDAGPHELDTLVGTLEPLLEGVVGEDATLRTRLAAPSAHVRPGRAEIAQIVINLVRNARDAIRNGGTITIRTEKLQASDTPQKAVLEVCDDGLGMDEDTRRWAFEPFFTTKQETEGAGLGLHAVAATARRYGGTVRLDSAPGHGTSVRVVLPCSEDPGDTVATPGTHAP